ncbi:MAG: HEPN domain-containing protein [Candidatus Gastranaerophilales bacterium]|nr:HEPN domain-containing protein [Candidatus Gastranaerophilales bacterium]
MQDKIIIDNWLLKSEEALREAEINIKMNCLQSAQNRLYYAIFYAVNALAKSKGFITSKHSQLLGWFNREYVKTEILPKEIAKIYVETYEFRQKSDYTFSFKPNAEKLKLSMNEAEVLINKIKKILVT